MPETREPRKNKNLVNRKQDLVTKKRDLLNFGSQGMTTWWQDSKTKNQEQVSGCRGSNFDFPCGPEARIMRRSWLEVVVELIIFWKYYNVNEVRATACNAVLLISAKQPPWNVSGTLFYIKVCHQWAAKTFVRHCQRSPWDSWSRSIWSALLARLSPQQDTSWQVSMALFIKSALARARWWRTPARTAVVAARHRWCRSNWSWWRHCQVSCRCTWQVPQSTKRKDIRAAIYFCKKKNPELWWLGLGYHFSSVMSPPGEHLAVSGITFSPGFIVSFPIFSFA